jgi:hypothetical protein
MKFFRSITLIALSLILIISFFANRELIHQWEPICAVVLLFVAIYYWARDAYATYVFAGIVEKEIDRLRDPANANLEMNIGVNTFPIGSKAYEILSFMHTHKEVLPGFVTELFDLSFERNEGGIIINIPEEKASEYLTVCAHFGWLMRFYQNDFNGTNKTDDSLQNNPGSAKTD